AERMRVPPEWFALSAGARISMTSGTENMDWTAAALKRIVEFTQAGGETNIVRAGITPGAQRDWNAGAPTLLHPAGSPEVTPDRGWDQQRGRGDHRGCPAVLERRSDDAHAHQGHPGDDTGLGDGAHR